MNRPLFHPMALILCNTKRVKEIKQMTLTERNQRLYELRHKLNMKRAEVKMVEGEMNRVRDEYERAQFDIPGNSLYDQMFGG